MFISRLQSACDAKGVSLSYAVKAVDGSIGSIGGWRSGRAPVSDVVVRLAQYLDTSCDYLLGTTDDPAPITNDMRRLDEREQRLVDGLRAAPDPIRDTAFNVAFAALGAHVPGVAASAAPVPVFSRSDGGEVAHRKAPDPVLKAYPKLAQLGLRKGVAPGVYKPVQGKVAAGPPIATVPESERRIAVPVKYTGEQYFIVQAEGDSMPGVANDGDYCVINKRGLYDNGRVVLVQVDGRAEEPDATLKRIYRLPGNKVELRSENPKYLPMIYPAEEVVIMGELVAVFSPESCELPAR